MADKTLESLIKYVLDNWEHFALKEAKPTTLLPRMVSRKSSVSGIIYKAIGLFAADAKQPYFYVEVLPNKFKFRYKNKCKNLKLLSKEKLSKTIQQTIPSQPLLFEFGKFTYFVAKYVSAMPLDYYLDTENDIGKIIDYGKMCLGWLSSFQKEKLQLKQFSLTDSQGELKDLSGYFTGLTPQAEAIFQGIDDDLKKYQSAKIPYVLSHGDFAPENILVEAHKIVEVIDWEEFSLARLPMMDLLKFVIVLTVNRAKVLRKDQLKAASYFEWLVKELGMFLSEYNISEDFFNSYAKIALIESVNSLLDRGQTEKMKPEQLPNLKFHGLQVFYQEKSFIDHLMKVVLHGS